MGLEEFAFSFNRGLLEARLRIKHYLMEGNYTWFKPIVGTQIETKLLELNKKLLQIYDDDTLKRTSKKNNNTFETRIFSF